MRKYYVASRISNRATCVLTRQSYTVIYETRSKIWYIDYSVVPFAFCTEYLRFECINVEVDALASNSIDMKCVPFLVLMHQLSKLGHKCRLLFLWVVCVCEGRKEGLRQ